MSLIINSYSKYKSMIFKDDRSKKLIFQPDGRNHYVYRITNNVTSEHYYGCRVTKLNPKDDLGIIYFSSSSNKRFIAEQYERPDDFTYKIINIFDNSGDNIICESYLHQKFQVSSNIKFINKSNQTPFGWTNTGNVYIGKKISASLLLNKNPDTIIKFQKTMSIINPDTGNTKARDTALKSAFTKSKINPDTGNTISTDAALKSAKTMRRINPESSKSYIQELGENRSKYLATINPNTGESYATELGKSHSGEKHGLFKGYYIIDNNKYITAAEASNALKISAAAIINWCKNNNAIISNISYARSKYLQSIGNIDDIVGKTFNDLGFSFQYTTQ